MKENKELFYEIDMENIKRLKPILRTVAGILLIQIFLYMLGDNSEFKELVFIKFIIVASIEIILLFFNHLKSNHFFFQKHSQKIMQFVTLWLIVLAVISSFYAQEISSDITIYIMVLFVITAGVRMRPLLAIMNIIISYTIFVIGMPFFQSDSSFLTAHIINGAIINILAFMIASMFYKYSLNEYIDKINIEKTNILLKNLSERDALTGLYNIRTINEILDSYLESKMDENEQLYLGMLDLDNFKKVNDKYGHAYGDAVLKAVAGKILENIRSTDIAGRYGGDEFLIIFKGDESHQIEHIMKRLLKEVCEIDFKDVNITFSCGVVAWNGESRNELFERADSYMYLAKNSGKNHIKFQYI